MTAYFEKFNSLGIKPIRPAIISRSCNHICTSVWSNVLLESRQSLEYKFFRYFIGPSFRYNAKLLPLKVSTIYCAEQNHKVQSN